MIPLTYARENQTITPVQFTIHGTSLQGVEEYKAFGEARYQSGTLPTQHKYTGQLEIEFGLIHYGPRAYDPYLNRFLSPDTIIPDQYDPQSWDRYAYTRNNPMNFTDPTGHKECVPSNDGRCDTFEADINKLIDLIKREAGKPATDSDKDGYAETADKNAPAVSTGTIPGCAQSTYTECFYSRQLLDINKMLKMNIKQLADLIIAVYYDLNKRSKDISDRQAYDTPFWDAYGQAPGDVCIGGQCFKRQEVNYFAQGMYTAANGEARFVGKATVYAWKRVKYWESPSEGTLSWFDFGYDLYWIIK